MRRANYSRYDVSGGNRKQTNIYKYKKSEAYLCHELYHRLKLAGVEAIPEFVDGPCKYDFLIVKGGKPVAVVEVKGSRASVNMDQLSKYEAMGSFKVPILVLAGDELFEEVYNKVVSLCS